MQLKLFKHCILCRSQRPSQIVLLHLSTHFGTHEPHHMMLKNRFRNVSEHVWRRHRLPSESFREIFCGAMAFDYIKKNIRLMIILLNFSFAWVEEMVNQVLCTSTSDELWMFSLLFGEYCFLCVGHIDSLFFHHMINCSYIERIASIWVSYHEIIYFVYMKKTMEFFWSLHIYILDSTFDKWFPEKLAINWAHYLFAFSDEFDKYFYSRWKL